MLIGGDCREDDRQIRASIEALNAAQAGTHVTFTQDAWEAIYRVKDELYPEDRIVGWYHSHPGFGVFLSEHDLFIQKNFFSSPGQVAWVYDPHTDEEGCFGWISGEVHRLSSLSVMDRTGDGVERTPKSSDQGRSSPDDELDDAVVSNSSGKLKSAPAWQRWAGMILTSRLDAATGIQHLLLPVSTRRRVDHRSPYRHPRPVAHCFRTSINASHRRVLCRSHSKLPLAGGIRASCYRYPPAPTTHRLHPRSRPAQGAISERRKQRGNPGFYRRSLGD